MFPLSAPGLYNVLHDQSDVTLTQRWCRASVLSIGDKRVRSVVIFLLVVLANLYPLRTQYVRGRERPLQTDSSGGILRHHSYDGSFRLARCLRENFHGDHQGDAGFDEF